MGDVKEEEEPEGEVVVGPSGEAIVYSSGNMFPISLTLIIIIILCTFSNHSLMRWIFILISCADDSESEEEAQVVTKEEEELGILCSWMEMGGLPMLDEVEVQKLLQEVGSLFLPDTYMAVFLTFSFLLPISALTFQGLGMLRRASTLKEEACCLEEEAQQLEMEGLGKIEAAVAGSEAEGFYRLLRRAIAHPPTSVALPPSKKACHAPSATASHLPPQESTGPDIFKPVTGITEQASEAASPAALPALEEALPTHMQSLCIQLGASRECIDARLKVANRDHQPHMPQSVCMCTKCTWGGVGVSLL